MCPKVILSLIGNRKANVAITFALAMIPMVYLTGMSIDYVSATRKQAKLNAIADSAVLAALTPAMLQQTLKPVPPATTPAPQQAAENFFNAQVSSISGLTNGTSVTVTVTDTTSGAGTARTATLAYTAQSQNSFPGVLNLSSITLAGTSTATASLPTNIDFYLLLDNSGSMAIPATSAGINTMLNNTIGQETAGVGCAFACHQADGAAINPPNAGNIDNYQLAKNLGVTTRIQLVGNAATQLAQTASQVASVNKATYRMGLYTFNTYNNNTQANMQVVALTSNLSKIQSLPSGTIDVMEVYKNNNITQSNQNFDTDTDFDSAMSVMNTIMPPPGTGLSGSTPQEVLLIVTDGVDDSFESNLPSSCTGSVVPSQNNRCMEPFNTSSSTSWCTSIKNAGIRIAVLYTVYLPMTSDGWYNTYIAPVQQWNNPAGNDAFATSMQNCASPGLYASVTTDGDIAAALNTLFQEAVQSAHLTH
jgi:Flp pilus assembly protein TadG